MRQTILGKITASVETANTDDTPNDTTETPKPSEKGLTACTDSFCAGYACDRFVRQTERRRYAVEILKQQLAFMR